MPVVLTLRPLQQIAVVHPKKSKWPWPPQRNPQRLAAVANRQRVADHHTWLDGRRTLNAVRLPTFYYGWIVVGALAITEPVSWGILYYGFGVMLTPIQHEMGWSQTELTGAFSLMLLVSGIMAIPVGRWLDRHGARGLMTT